MINFIKKIFEAYMDAMAKSVEARLKLFQKSNANM